MLLKDGTVAFIIESCDYGLPKQLLQALWELVRNLCRTKTGEVYAKKLNEMTKNKTGHTSY